MCLTYGDMRLLGSSTGRAQVRGTSGRSRRQAAVEQWLALRRLARLLEFVPTTWRDDGQGSHRGGLLRALDGLARAPRECLARLTMRASTAISERIKAAWVREYVTSSGD